MRRSDATRDFDGFPSPAQERWDRWKERSETAVVLLLLVAAVGVVAALCAHVILFVVRFVMAGQGV